MSVVRRNNVRVHGEGPPIMFVHGFGCDQSMWRFITPAFAARHKIVLIDLVGMGGSDLAAYDRTRYSRLDGYAEDIVEICQELELRDVTLVGHSVSAIIGALAVIRAPKLFSSLVLVAPSPCYLNDGDYRGGFSRADIDGLLEMLDSNYLGWSKTMAPVIMGAPDKPELTEELTNSFCRTDPDIAKHFAHVTFLSDNRADLPNVPVRSLVLQCKEDAIAPIAVGEYVQRAIPNSKLVIIPTTGHCPHLSEPGATIEAMQHFLQG